MIDPLGDQLPARVERQLRLPLPGRRAHRRMRSELSYGRHYGPPSVDVRQAAVLVLLVPRDGQWHVPLIQRPQHMVDHAGQISFPGGMREPGEVPEQCAVREYEEELGTCGRTLELLGRLSPLYVFASNFWVVPCVAVTGTVPTFVPHAGEVARVLDLPLTWTWDAQHYATREIGRRGLRFRARTLLHNDDLIWGATGMMLAELAEVTAAALS